MLKIISVTLRVKPCLCSNRPYCSCVLSCLAFEWLRGWRWPCFDTDLSAFSFECQLVNTRTTWFTQQKQRGLYQNKITSCLAAIQRLGHRADNCKMVHWRNAQWGFITTALQGLFLLLMSMNKKREQRYWVCHLCRDRSTSNNGQFQAFGSGARE